MALGSQDNARIPEPETVHLAAGNIVVLASDGVVGALNADRVPFGLERIQHVIGKTVNASARDILKAITEALGCYASSTVTPSDRTVVVIKCTR